MDRKNTISWPVGNDENLLCWMLSLHKRLHGYLAHIIKHNFEVKNSLKRINEGIEKIDLFLTEAKVLSVLRDNYIGARAVIEDRKKRAFATKHGEV